MDFEIQTKDLCFQGILRCLFENHGYRVVPCGIEHNIRELNVNTPNQNKKLEIPESLKTAPDFIVFNKAQTKSWSVVAEYYERVKDINLDRFKNVVKIHNKTYFIVFIFNSPEAHFPKKHSFPSYNIRVLEGDVDKDEEIKFSVDISNDEKNWWDLSRLQDVFKLFTNNSKDSNNTIWKSVDVLLGINNSFSNFKGNEK